MPDINKTRKVNLGCGDNIMVDWINIDKQDHGQDIVRDILRGLPFDSNSVDEINAWHLMEHIAVGEDLKFVMEEIYRVLKPKGTIFIRVPHSSTQEAFYPDHKSYWNEKMVNALLHDKSQKGNYRFEILDIHRSNIELRVKLKKL